MNTNRIVGNSRWMISALLCLSIPAAFAAPVSFYRIGDLPGGIFYSQIRDAVRSKDGILAVGGATQYDGSVSCDTAIMWTPAKGIQPLPTIVPNTTPLLRNVITASAISANGKVIASRSRSQPTGQNRLAVIARNRGTTLTVLGQIPGALEFSAATSISADGSVAYGWNWMPDAVPWGLQGLRWTASEGLTPLGFLFPGDIDSTPASRGISADGSVVVGVSTSDPSSGLGRAYRYQHGRGMTALPLLPGGTWNAAFAVTPSGKTVIGSGDSAANPNGEIVKWTSHGRVKSLGVPNVDAIINPAIWGGVTKNGNVVLYCFDVSYVRNRNGWFDLPAILATTGVDLHDWIDFQALGISADGTLVFGWGDNSLGIEGWIAEFPRGYLAALGKHSCDRDDDEEDEDDDG